MRFSDKNIPSANIKEFDQPFKFISNVLSIKDKTIYLIIPTTKSRSIIPILHKHYCVEKIYLYRPPDVEFSANSQSMSEKISGWYSDITEIYDKIVNDISEIINKPLQWNRSIDIFTMLHTQRLDNRFFAINVSADVPGDEYIIVLNVNNQELFHIEHKYVPVIEFNDVEECLQQMNKFSKFQIFLIIIGDIILSEIQSIFDCLQIHAIYFFRNSTPKYPINKRKVSGFFDKQEDLSEQLNNDILFYQEHLYHTSRLDIFSALEHTGNIISQLNHQQIGFLIYNLFIHILPQIPLLEYK